MVSFIQFLDELDQSGQTAVIPPGDVRRMALRFGPKIHSIGIWNKTGDGSLQIPMSNIAEAARRLDHRLFSQAVEQLKSPEHVTHVLNHSSAASQLIDTLAEIHLAQFHRRVERLQESTDPAEVDRLRDQISRELFGA